MAATGVSAAAAAMTLNAYNGAALGIELRAFRLDRKFPFGAMSRSRDSARAVLLNQETDGSWLGNWAGLLPVLAIAACSLAGARDAERAISTTSCTEVFHALR